VLREDRGDGEFVFVDGGDGELVDVDGSDRVLKLLLLLGLIAGRVIGLGVAVAQSISGLVVN
jgi:hypothetical protein